MSNSPLPAQQERPRLRGRRVLIVDADASVRLAAHELLGPFGCEVETVENGTLAFSMVRNSHYDVALVDIRLTDMSGYDCFHQLREIHPYMPVILMTGYGYDPSHSIVKARQEGLRSVLYKPYRRDQLLTEIEKAVTPPGLATNPAASPVPAR